MVHFKNLPSIQLIVLSILILNSCDAKSNKRIELPRATKSEIPKKKIIQNLSAQNLVTNIYLENSGSMFGYVSGGGNFVNVVSQIAGDCDLEFSKVNYSLINGTETFLGDNLVDFIDALSPIGMDRGNVLTSDLNDIFRIALENSGENRLSIIISDGIYSVDCKGKGAPSALCLISKLKSKSIELRNTFVRKLETEEISTYLVKYETLFEGDYYPAEGGKQFIKQIRPYYVWVFGNEKNINSIFTENYFKKLPGFKEIVKFVQFSNNAITSQISIHNQVGQFKIRDPKSLLLEDVEPNRMRELRFGIAIDFSKTPFPNSYFYNKQIYENNLGYEIEEVVDPEKLNPISKAGLKGNYTHIISLKKSGNPYGDLNLIIKDLVPNWIEESSVDNDSNITGNTRQTFGFKYLIEGILNAYKKVKREENIAEFKIKITQ